MGLQTHFWGVGVWWGWLWLFFEGGTPLEAIRNGNVAIDYHRKLLSSVSAAKRNQPDSHSHANCPEPSGLCGEKCGENK